LLSPTTDIWTSGIVNVPLDPLLRDFRYTFFELDTKKIKALHEVLNVYREYLGSVYVHETINGYHFYNLSLTGKNLYGIILRKLKHLNRECPMTTLRIIPNKWQNEKKYWIKDFIEVGDSVQHSRLVNFNNWLINDHLHMITQNYQVVRYPLEECPKCKTSTSIVWNNDRKIFICTECHVQSIGRLLKK